MSRSTATASRVKPSTSPLMLVQNLQVEFAADGGVVQDVRDVSYEVHAGQTLAIVGESGCGKSVSVQAILGLIPTPPGRITQGSALFDGIQLVGLSAQRLNQLRGDRIGMIFQDPMTSLNPTMKIGAQVAETLIVHRGMDKTCAHQEAIRLLDRTRIPEAGKRANQYPFEFSGGMLQRVMIAMSLACKPALLIADEPTTALDVTIQNQVLELMREIQREEGMAIILITHDLGVVARMADEVAVMYAGQIIESGSVEDIFYHSSHPYTVGLKRALPEIDSVTGTVTGDHIRLLPIEGSPPDLFSPPSGCAYHPRCPHAMAVCTRQEPENYQKEARHMSSCWLEHPWARPQAS